ncbi:P-loop containing nucleoside triphosphate hydrolase protein [Podospora fimiseda]|uniref:P-loop containing nucleoside triphosphate hydrolase protein n=1 Tax=Podospora fimiseda TaxID=252190 RepID=A0AAN7BTP3_9PEZI|nr:P-loop containing nucleoside triphosphate hydrolase protein [Podospora fimiseda]
MLSAIVYSKEQFRDVHQGGSTSVSPTTTLVVLPSRPHCIRNQSTGLFKAAANLTAERRWCLTGTPIQNRLDDLRSLLKFLQNGPLSESRDFKKYIEEPIAKNPDQDESFRNLQILLRTLCLRKTEALLDLPPSTTEIVNITLTPEEATAYGRLERDCQEEYERQLCTKAKVNTSALMLDTISKRRRLCNHGTYPIEELQQRSPSPSGRSRMVKKSKSSKTSGDYTCVLCSSPDEDAVAALDGADESPMSPSMLPTGYSSKLTAVVQNIHDSCTIPGNNSIVFTSWRTLNLLGMLLTEKGITFLRIDGQVPSIDRTAILSQFNTDPAIPVIIFTVDSGAVGLTITRANRVHLVEPIYNPAIEAQAIDRVLRMGQTRPVTIIKYITEKTVEPLYKNAKDT